MARNEEKAQSMLNRYLRGKAEERGEYFPGQERPYLASMCDRLDAAEQWRNQVLREISRRVVEIQNKGLGESRIRDVNDQINKLLREKYQWERRIRELGGPDYSRSALPVGEGEAIQIRGSKGYYYFGAARELPGVKELLKESYSREEKKRSRAELYKCVDAEYYGFLDDNDPNLEQLEYEAELEARKALVEKWETDHMVPSNSTKRAQVDLEELSDEDEPEESSILLKDENAFRKVKPGHESQVEQLVLDRKKRQLLEQVLNDEEGE
ncbi:Pre-mRNA-splicing factor ISY1 [Galdieria sulphuraria]|nr:Pre-mRNA-splicing factor ISY1 [Galdieria sulphuraria]